MSNPVTPPRTENTETTSRWSARFKRFEARTGKSTQPQSVSSDSVFSTPFETDQVSDCADYEPDDEDQQPSRKRKYAEMSAESEFDTNIGIGISIPRRHAIAQECINGLKVKYAFSPEDEAEMMSFSEVCAYIDFPS